MSCEMIFPTYEVRFDSTVSDETVRSLKEHRVKIKFLDYGCIVSIGCKRLVFETNEKMLKALTEYTQDPEKTSKKWLKKLNK